MTSNNVNINNKDQGLVELNDITQKVVINTDKNVENVLDIFNRKSLKKNKKNNDFLEKISNIEDLDVFFQNLSKHHLFIRNTLFSKKHVFFEDIYVPLNIKLSENLIRIKNNSIVEKESIQIDDNFLIENFSNQNIINIVGWAGQGKSTVLCKIFVNQIKKGKLIPIFLTFRNINESILIELRRLFEDNNIECDEHDIIFLLRSKKIILIIDAFDEISNEELKTKLISEIKRIQRYGVEIVCSSRPGTLLCNQPGIENYDLQDLNFEQVVDIINKTRSREEENDKILTVLEKNNNVRDSLKTPLLTVLFVKIYPTMDIIPEHAREFYDEIFNILYMGHDKHKEGNRILRNLTQKYTRSETKFAFTLLCFTSFLNNVSSFTLNEAEKFLEKGINTFKNKIPNAIQTLDINNFLLELIECTSLLIIDGLDNNNDYYSYLHKTIQEYHAAHFFKEFIKNETSEVQLNFFKEFIIKNMFEDPTYIIEFLKFLSVIDTNFVKLNILIPFFEKNFYKIGCSRVENINNSVDVIKENMVELVEVNIFSTIQKTSELPKLHLKINGSVNSYEQGFRAQETGLIALNIDSKLKEIICSIAYLFNLDAKFEDLFSRLISLFTNFKTNEVFPLTPKEQNILEKGEVLRREFSTDINSLSKRPGYKEVYSSLLENLNELCTAVYDELYIPLKEQATQMNDTVSNKIESLDNLFKN